MNGAPPPRVAVVIPCYRVRDAVLAVLAAIPRDVERIYCVDDACPDASGDHIEAHNRDARVRVIRHTRNQGVGGAVVSGYRQAIEDGIDIVVKIDGDGQMDPDLLWVIAGPILRGEADYAKGNRFYAPEALAGMPPVRLIGNAILSFLTKLSCGYWNIFDPTNGYTAIETSLLQRLPLSKITRDYFFESDMLFRLNTIGAVVSDVPMSASYRGETSSLRIGRVVGPFLRRHIRNLWKRIVYNYFLRDFHVASVELLVGIASLSFGVIFGLVEWISHVEAGTGTATGTIMLAALSVLVGVQMLLAFLNYDIASVPRRPIHPNYRATAEAHGAPPRRADAASDRVAAPGPEQAGS